MLFSGGEPLVRRDLPELAAYAVEKGMRAVISTNGTLIDPENGKNPERNRIVLCRHQSGWYESRSTIILGV
jgi:MoaA/NifB/PqqE/SkfB family radical SAM enzyme